MPERTRKSREYPETLRILVLLPETRTTAQVMTRITAVRMAVARLESTFRTPILARIAVNAAKTAERTA